MHVLGTGRLRTTVTPEGGSTTTFDGLTLTRATPDAPTSGPVVYIRDAASGRVWTAGLMPGQAAPDVFEARLEPGCAGYRRVDGAVETTLEIAVSPENSVEVRRIGLTNHGEAPVTLEVTTYLEAVLNSAAGDRSHPAFSKLFVQTAYVPETGALVAERRLRSPHDEPLALAHTLVPDDDAPGEAAYETDRLRFLGRTGTLAKPAALAGTAPLSGTTGAVLDPVLALRRTVTLAPGQRRTLTATLGAGATRTDALTACFAGLSGARSERAFAQAAQAAEPGEAQTFAPVLPAAPASRPAADVWAPDETPPAPGALAFDNGYGGFADAGRAYVVRVFPGRFAPPLPWSNVLAGETAGCIATEQGLANTWAHNSRENRLTPWSNDPVSDPPSETLWVRDEAAGVHWSLTPGPAGVPAWHTVTHRWGTTEYAATYGGLAQHVTVWADPLAPVRVVEVALTNTGDAPRRLALGLYTRLVLGGEAHATAPSVTTATEGATVFARHDARTLVQGHVAFSHATGATATHAQHGPAAAADLPGARLMDTPDAAPVAAHGIPLTLAPGETWTGAWLLGEGTSEDDARALVARFADAALRAEAKAAMHRFWEGICGAVQVETPVPELDLMANGWLAYQNLACRILARSAFYQSGGAFGFRDQLQDASAFAATHPDRFRRQILLHAAHQFEPGDVLHWWHPPDARGIRTRFSDDLLWLPYFAAHYVDTTGDASLLDESVGFVEAPPLAEGEDEAFGIPARADATASVYEHACRAIDRSLATGAHGLPLMGVGDWNDGMNRVGREGRGESVFVGFFLYSILGRWSEIAAARGDTARAERYRAHRAALHTALNADGAGWDGAWYRRAYYDNGAVLGSQQSDECQIDALAQAWAVLSGAADARPRRPGPRRDGSAPRGPRRGPHPPAHARLRPDAQRPRLHQGLPARRARKRRPVHARRPLGRPR